MKKISLCLLFCWITLSAWSQKNPVSALMLKWNADSIHDLNAKVVQGVLEAKTTGNDAWIYTGSLTEPVSKEQVILSFEYFCPKGLDHLQIFFCPPLSQTKYKLIRRVSPSEGWMSFSVDLSEQIKNWGQAGDYLRLDFGEQPGIMLQVRNLQLRAKTDREKQVDLDREEKQRKEHGLDIHLQDYLSRVYTSGIDWVGVDEKQITIRGKADQADQVYICEVTPCQDVTEDTAAFETAIPLSDRSFFIKVDRYIKRDGFLYDRLLSKWVLAEKINGNFHLISHARYPDAIRALYDLPYEKPQGRKGLGGFSVNRGYTDDLDNLGITSATVNIWFGRFMYSAPGPDRIEYSYNGKSYYFGKKEVETFDSTFRTTARKGIITAAILLIDKAEACPDPVIGRLLQHPDMDPAGIFSMPNMTNPASVDCYAAALDFLASRYSRADKKYGRINHWIMHNEVDAGWAWTNMGEKTAHVFMDAYVKSMRMCYDIARKYNPHSEVFISLTHYWAWTSDPHFYPSKDLMEILLQYTKAEGDFQWGMAQHPYPRSLFEPKTWLDQQVSFDFNTPLITFKNLEVLNAWIQLPEVLYKGTVKRTLWLSENGTNSLTYSDQDLKEQAAGFAYTWKKLKHLEGIDAFQWHNWIDSRGEGGLRIGLRRFPDDPEDPGAPKPVWYVYQAADRPSEDSVFSPYKEVIGIKDWDEVNYIGEIDQVKKRNSFRNLNTGTWVATDALGRSLPGSEECGPAKNDRLVGIFYFMTHISPGGKGPFDVTKIIKANPENPKWGEGDHYWGEPEPGYYLSNEKWVIRRHARELSDAGVDVIIFDVTNDRTYPEVYLPVCEVYREMRAEGEKTPDIAFLGSEISVNKLWNEFYKKGMYPDLWFIWEGKPLILFGQHEIPSRKKNNDVVFSQEIRDFFSIRQSWAWTSLPWYQSCPWGKDKWPWVDHYPQAIGWHESPDIPEMVPVAVAQHPLSNIGRSFHNFHQPPTDKYDLTPYTGQGLCFQEQWDRALEVGPEFVFVTGWNEWSAGAQVMGKDINKSLQVWKFYPGAQLGKAGKELKPGDYYFIDQYNQEFSRDIEPMTGGHTDNYYYQLMANIRRYKGMGKENETGSFVNIDMSGDFIQWEQVHPVYYDHIGDTDHRNSSGQGQAGPYIDNSGRNDIVESRVACDQDNIYFYVKTKDTITAHTDPNWMLLFIDADQNKATGWEGYDYVVNARVINNNTSTVSALRKNAGFASGKEIRYKQEGNQLMLSIPRRYLGMQDQVKFDFHWADNIQKIGDITEFFLHGDNAPERRANYRFEATK